MWIYNKLYFKIRVVVVTWYEGEGFINRVFMEKTPQNYGNLQDVSPDKIIKYLFFPNWTLQVWIVQWFQSLGKNLVSYLYIFTSSIDTVDNILNKGVYLQGIPASLMTENRCCITEICIRVYMGILAIII